MKRPMGHTVLASLLLLSCAGGLAQLFWRGAELPIELPRLVTLANIVTTAAALVAAIAIWRGRSWAAEAYLGWMVASLASMAYLQVTLAPRILALFAAPMGISADALPRFPMGIVVAAVLFHGAFLALGYWYLRTHRPVASAPPTARAARERREDRTQQPAAAAR